MNNLKSNPKSPFAANRPADELIKKNRLSLNNQFVLIGSRQVRIWHMLVAVAFIAGTVSALVWAGAGDKFIKIFAAPENIVEVRSQAQASYQDASGNNYAPVTSNEVVIPVSQ
ncbi:MAG TPA: hypothetical protein P5267_01135 [Patescibacteria group bacterium]|nr:hypothetical protein [Patescibacteria group bacterium]